MNVSVVNLGCKVNRVESDTISLAYQSRGCEVTSPDDADIIVVNTCTVTGEAEKKTRKTIRKLLRQNQEAKLLITGCAATISPDELSALDPRVFIIDKAELLADSTEALRIGDTFPTRVGVKVQDGCNHSCTYCIVHVARGKAWSRPCEDIVTEVVFLAESGVKEVVLTGIDLGSYHFENQSLVTLLRTLLEKTAHTDIRFRISSIEPCSIQKELIDLIAKSKGRICRHLHLPLQSGSSKVLKEMNRPYSSEFFLELCTDIKKQIPDISLSTDIIVGFPGETDQDFQETLSLAKRVGFTKIHVFRYSKRQGTPAAQRLDQISPEIKEQRAHELSCLGNELRQAYAQAYIGTNQDVVIEQPGLGTTESYYKIVVSKDLPVNTKVILAPKGFNERGVYES